MEINDRLEVMGDWSFEHEGVDIQVTHAPGEPYEWEATLTESFISGPYPGTPDWKEHIIGVGSASSLKEARWFAIRAIERAMVREDVYAWEELAHYAADPDFPDPTWWAPGGPRDTVQ